MDEFLILQNNRNYCISWLNEDLIRIIYSYYSYQEYNELDISDIANWDRFYNIYERHRDECLFDYAEGDYYYFYILDIRDNWREAFTYGDPRKVIEERTHFCINRRNIANPNLRVNAKMDVADIVRLLQENMLIKEAWI